jgi:hypothetical protein
MKFTDFKKLWDEGLKKTLGSDDAKMADGKRKIHEVRDRFRDLKIWNEAKNQPVFGWAPVVYGWRIEVWDAGIAIEWPFNGTFKGGAEIILINRVPWRPGKDMEISWTHESPWSEGA